MPSTAQQLQDGGCARVRVSRSRRPGRPRAGPIVSATCYQAAEPSGLPERHVLPEQGRRGLSELRALHAARRPQRRHRSPAVVWVPHASPGSELRGAGRAGASEALREDGQAGSGDVP